MTLDLPTLIVADLVIGVTVTLLLLVSRATLGMASSGALSWTAGDVLLGLGSLFALADQRVDLLPWLDAPFLHLLPDGVAAGALAVAGIWWHRRALDRFEGQHMPVLRVAGESLFAFVAWLMAAGVMPDVDARIRLLVFVLAVGAVLTMPPLWRLSRHFWGARMILLVMVVIALAQTLRGALNLGAGGPVAPGELSRLFLMQLVISLTLTISFVVLMQEQVRQRLIELSIRDPLTGLYNRRGLLTLLQRDYEQASRARRPLSLVLFDLDHFKKVNDTAGHDAGDAVLREFSACLRLQCRRGDLIGRWGGEEFVVVMPEANLQQALAVAERIRLAVRQGPLVAGLAPVTVSGGVAEAVLALETRQGIEGLIAAADRCLYSAKVQRDQVCGIVNGQAVAA